MDRMGRRREGVMEAVAAVKSVEREGTVPAVGSAGRMTVRAHEVNAQGADQTNSGTSFAEVEQESREKVERIAQVMDDFVKSSQRSLKIQVHSATGRTMVRVISKEDGRTIREIPPEQVLNLAAKMEEMMGYLFDKKV